MIAALRLKEICLQSADTIAVDLSEAMYSYIQTGISASNAIRQFCWQRREGECAKFEDSNR